MSDQERSPLYGSDLRDGVYSIDVDSDSSMFRIVEARLMVENGDMQVLLTLSGKGYSKLYMGTGKEAEGSPEEGFIPFEENGEGAYTYKVPIAALNQETACAAFSKRKERWYDRKLVFLSDRLPEEAILRHLAQVQIPAEDGAYTVEVSLFGGTGRAGITSPARLDVTEGMGTAFLEWSSPDFDYMVVNGEKLLPVNTEGNSVFEVPVWVLDQEMEVLADTVAMSVPHEVEYNLIFHGDTLRPAENPGKVFGIMNIAVMSIGAAMAVLALTAGIRCYKRKEKARKSGYGRQEDIHEEPKDIRENPEKDME